MKRLLAAAATVLALWSAAGMAATAAQDAGAAYLAEFDTDHDGRVSLNEYVAWMQAGFTRLDRNGDGILETTELPPGPRSGAIVSAGQHRANVIAAFHRQDTNHDGFLNLQELLAPPR